MSKFNFTLSVRRALMQRLANRVNIPGGSSLLRNRLAQMYARKTGYTVKTVCKYVEVLLGKHHREIW